MAVSFKQNDRLPSLTVTATQADGTAYDLTGATGAVFHLRNSETGAVKLSSMTATVVNAAQGILRYDWGTNDLDTAGLFDAEFEVTMNTGRKITVPTQGYISVRVVDDIA